MRSGKRVVPRPTAGEVEILGVLWETGPATVRQVFECLSGRKETGYTTVLKLMQIMTEKGLLEREESGRAHLYHPVLKKEETQGQLLDELLDRAFGGSAAELVMRALSRRCASKEEIEEIRRMLDEAQGGER
jgi:BlaI family penicillinase repressor